VTERHQQLIAYLATLGALVIVVIASMLIAAWVPAVLGKMEAFGLGTITGGLIGVLRLPTQRNVTVDNPPENPANVQETR
jgi:hypothetical protein